MSEPNNIVKALQEFQTKQETLTTGYLVLANDQILHFANRKDWEEHKLTLPPNHRCFKWVDLEAWHNWKNYRK